MIRHTTKNGVTLLVDIPDGSTLESAILRACRGNDRVAQVLHYFLYAASKEVKDKDLKGCNVVTVSRTHEKIMEYLRHKPARKSLIRYLDILNEWKLVLSESYKRDFAVDLRAIQEAITNPPAPAVRKRLYEKGCKLDKVTTLQPFDDKRVSELEEKVVSLHNKVVSLQREVCKLTTFCGQITTLQRDFEALQKSVEGHFFSPTYITKDITYITEEESSVASLDAMNTPPQDDDLAENESGTIPEEIPIDEHPIATATPTDAPQENVEIEQDALFSDAMPLTEDAWRALRTAFESKLSATWKACKAGQGLRLEHRTWNDYRRVALASWEKQHPKPTKADQLWASLLPEERETVKRWHSLRRGEVITPTDVEGAQMLRASGLTLSRQQLLDERDWLRLTQPGWYGLNGKLHGRVSLKDIAANAAAWLETIDLSNPPQDPPPGDGVEGATEGPVIVNEIERRQFEAYKARKQATLLAGVA